MTGPLIPLHPARRRRPRALLLLVALVAIGWLALSLIAGPPPELSIHADRPGVGRRPTVVVVEAAELKRGIGTLVVEAIQGESAHRLAETSLTTRPAWAPWRERSGEHRLEVEIGKESVPGLAPGELTVRARATGAPSLLGSTKGRDAEIVLPVRFTPPSLSVESSQHNVAQGGSGLVVYRVGASAVEAGGRDGVQAGDRFFPGHELGGGRRFALFGIPYDLSDPSAIRLVAADSLGNEATAPFVDRFFARPPARDRIELNDRFLNKVVPEIQAETPDVESTGDLLADYLVLNGELRRKNAATLTELSRQSKAEWLWRGAFHQMPNSLVTSRFADDRTYVYDGREVDHQFHLGYDLATRAHDVVPASNRGVVLLARYFGIYGKTVVLDHGYGLMSLSSHLSSIAVEEGQLVESGQELGRSGQTGLAGGDHLHYTLLIDGLPVDPVEWWDEKWVRERILSKLGPAGEGDLGRR